MTSIIFVSCEYSKASTPKQPRNDQSSRRNDATERYNILGVGPGAPDGVVPVSRLMLKYLCIMWINYIRL